MYSRRIAEHRLFVYLFACSREHSVFGCISPFSYSNDKNFIFSSSLSSVLKTDKFGINENVLRDDWRILTTYKKTDKYTHTHKAVVLNFLISHFLSVIKIFRFCDFRRVWILLYYLLFNFDSVSWAEWSIFWFANYYYYFSIQDEVNLMKTLRVNMFKY